MRKTETQVVGYNFSETELQHVSALFLFFNQSINQYIYNVPWYRGACYSADYAETKTNVLSRILNVLTDGAVRQFRGSEFQSFVSERVRYMSSAVRLSVCNVRAPYSGD